MQRLRHGTYNGLAPFLFFVYSVLLSKRKKNINLSGCGTVSMVWKCSKKSRANIFSININDFTVTHDNMEFDREAFCLFWFQCPAVILLIVYISHLKVLTACGQSMFLTTVISRTKSATIAVKWAIFIESANKSGKKCNQD